ncbi:MAG TPA: polysaccharide biosynthesis/export family protein [Bacillota bacterium]|jgi:polysaccharide export outer membrane protein|nr:polysaccharide biosynthesis/export family protein [Bacillota bacterium]HOL08773.1 polysaccharide biosynthesis/export family protein [Bacillota bacterium]HPO96324.1 polysaccharide biosynthesis/export family protein [Bacillota bacterium]
MKNFWVVLLVMLLLVTLPVWGAEEDFGQDHDYRLGPGDVLNFNVWVWGFESVQQQQVIVRPDGKIAVSFLTTDGTNYRLGPGDVLNISVWGYPELTMEIIIRPDGKGAFKLVGELDLNGKTPGELTELLQQTLSQYIKHPQVTVNVHKFRTIPVMGEFQAAGLTTSQLIAKITESFRQYQNNVKIGINIVKYRTVRVYVLGEVNRPGLYELEKGHRVLDALSIAGGFTRGAKKGRIYLIKNGDPSRYVEINLNQILKKGDLSQNYLLAEGDLLYLARSGMDFVKEIFPFINAFYQIKHLD